MWPERKLKLLVTSASNGLAGFQAFLNTIKTKNVVEIVHNQPIPSNDLGEFEPEVFTDIVIWPDVPLLEEEVIRGRNLGRQTMLPQEFLHDWWQTEVVLPVNPPFVCVGERPILWAILEEAGYSPSLVWENSSGSWNGHLGQGLGWVVPGNWLAKIGEQEAFGRQQKKPEITWVVREDKIDFYEVRERLVFRGSTQRWPEPVEEQAACQGIAQALELGVSWSDIARALSTVWQNIRQEWQLNEIGLVQGQGRTELSTEKLDNMEDRWAG